MYRMANLCVGAGALLLTGCVVVNPANVSVGGVLGSPEYRPAAGADPTVRETAYAHDLRKVIRQQDGVVKALQKHDWEELTDEATDWSKYTRILMGQAETSHDPGRFRRQTNELLSAQGELLQAAHRRDAARCEAALSRCGRLLDRLSIDFPQTVPAHRPTVTRTESSARPPRAASDETRVP